MYDWLDEVDKLTTDDPTKLVIANKCDLDSRVITKEEMNVIEWLIFAGIYTKDWYSYNRNKC